MPPANAQPDRYPVRVTSRQFPQLLKTIPDGVSQVTAEGCYTPQEFNAAFPGLDLKAQLSQDTELETSRPIGMADATIGPGSALIYLYRELYNQAVAPDYHINCIEAAEMVHPNSRLTLSTLRALLDVQARYEEDFDLAVNVFGAAPEDAVEYALELGLTLADLGQPPRTEYLAQAA